jgi:hypothetical protein
MVILRGGGIRGVFMPWNKNRKHHKLIYSTESGLIKIKWKFRLNYDIKCKNICIFYGFSIYPKSLVNIPWHKT